MGILRATDIQPEGATTALTLGASGDSVTVASTQLRANTFKDAGGNTLWTSNGSGNLSSVNSSLAGGGYVFISSQTITTAVNEVVFTTGIDSTYDEYVFIVTDIHVANNAASIFWNMSINGGGAYDGANRTALAWVSYNNAGSATQGLAYQASQDLGSTTGDLYIIHEQENGADANGCGICRLYQPSNTTFMTQFEVRTASLNYNNRIQDWHTAGYVMTTTPVDAVQFKCSSGNMDNGTFQLYGVA